MMWAKTCGSIDISQLDIQPAEKQLAISLNVVQYERLKSNVDVVTYLVASKECIPL